MSKEKWSGINPLKEKQYKILKDHECKDLADKVNELVRVISAHEQHFEMNDGIIECLTKDNSKFETQIKDIKDQCGKEMTVNVCNGKEDLILEKIRFDLKKLDYEMGNINYRVNDLEHPKDLPEPEEHLSDKEQPRDKPAFGDFQEILEDEASYRMSDYEYFENKAKKDLLKRMIKRSKNEGCAYILNDEWNKLK